MIEGFEGVVVFSATMPSARQVLGERVTAWLRGHPEREVVHTVVRQSSDAGHHCLTLVLFWRTSARPS